MNRIVVEVNGGVVTAVYTNIQKVDCVVLDHDNAKVDAAARQENAGIEVLIRKHNLKDIL